MPLFRRRRVPRRPDIWPRAWRRHPLAILVGLLIAAAVAWQRTSAPPSGSDADRYHNRTFTCVHVVDGDTLDIDTPDGRHPSTRIRLWGVDTPETVKPNTPPMYFGHEASEYVKNRAYNRKVRIELAPQHSRDKYDRLLAYVYPEGGDSMLNEDIIAGGYGYADPRFVHPWKQRFIQLEECARKAKQGLWANIQPQQMPDWRQRAERKY